MGYPVSCDAVDMQVALNHMDTCVRPALTGIAYLFLTLQGHTHGTPSIFQTRPEPKLHLDYGPGYPNH